MPVHGPRVGRPRRSSAAAPRSAAGRHVTLVLTCALLAVACSRSGPADYGGRVVILADSLDGSAAGWEVLALPGDRAAATALAASPNAARSTPVTPGQTAADSAALLDVRFQKLRAAINREAPALDAGRLDRRTRDYAAR